MSAHNTPAEAEGRLREARHNHTGYLRVNHDLLESLLDLPRGSVFRCEDGGPASVLVYVDHPLLPRNVPGKRIQCIGVGFTRDLTAFRRGVDADLG